MIESLTQEQIKAVEKYRDKWIAISTAGCDPSFYSPAIRQSIKEDIKILYQDSGGSITDEQIHFVSSPYMGPFYAAALLVGKAGKPRKAVKWAGDSSVLQGMKVVEDFLNTHTNPREIIKKANEMNSSRQWGVAACDDSAFFDFFMSETEVQLDKPKLEAFLRLSETTTDRIMLDGLCVVSMRPTVIIKDERVTFNDGIEVVVKK